jgi:TonB family protein
MIGFTIIDLNISRKFILLVALLICTKIGYAQILEKKFYKGATTRKEVPEAKATHVRTITKLEDGSVSTEWKILKTDSIINREVWKGEEPVGIWVNGFMNRTEKMDFNFQLEYTNQGCEEKVDIKNLFEDDLSVGYEAPKFEAYTLYTEFLMRNLRYPAKARRSGIQGNVQCIFNLTEGGTIENIRILKGVHLVLDKEAVRILRKLKFTTPPKLNGSPIPMCGVTTIRFKLA